MHGNKDFSWGGVYYHPPPQTGQNSAVEKTPENKAKQRRNKVRKGPLINPF